MTMLDWEEGRIYEITPGTRVQIFSSRRGSRTGSVPLSGMAARARTHSGSSLTDITASLIPGKSICGGVSSGLVRKEDVRFPLSWYLEKRLCGHRAAACVHCRQLGA